MQGKTHMMAPGSGRDGQSSARSPKPFPLDAITHLCCAIDVTTSDRLSLSLLSLYFWRVDGAKGTGPYQT
jgi:hypothetical protein